VVHKIIRFTTDSSMCIYLMLFLRLLSLLTFSPKCYFEVFYIHPIWDIYCLLLLRMTVLIRKCDSSLIHQLHYVENCSFIQMCTCRQQVHAHAAVCCKICTLTYLQYSLAAGLRRHCLTSTSFTRWRVFVANFTVRDRTILPRR